MNLPASLYVRGVSAGIDMAAWDALGAATDVNQSLTVTEAIRRGRALDDVDAGPDRRELLRRLRHARSAALRGSDFVMEAQPISSRWARRAAGSST